MNLSSYFSLIRNTPLYCDSHWNGTAQQAECLNIVWVCVRACRTLAYYVDEKHFKTPSCLKLLHVIFQAFFLNNGLWVICINCQNELRQLLIGGSESTELYSLLALAASQYSGSIHYVQKVFTPINPLVAMKGTCVEIQMALWNNLLNSLWIPLFYALHIGSVHSLIPFCKVLKCIASR